MRSKPGNKLKKIRGLVLIAGLALTGCILCTERKPDRILTIDCRNPTHQTDSAGVPHYSCSATDTMIDPRPPKP